MTENKLAVLIDADNVPYANVKKMLEEISKNGTPTIKRIYADWTRPNASGWKNVLLENAITPIQQYGYTTGKNSSDSAMIIDAMDILYSGKVNGFCIVSSDSDFYPIGNTLKRSWNDGDGLWRKENTTTLYFRLRQVHLFGNSENEHGRTEKTFQKQMVKPKKENRSVKWMQRPFN